MRWLLLALFFSTSALANPSMQGIWVPPGGDALLRLTIADEMGEIHLLRTLSSTEQDEQNPDKKKRLRPLAGLKIGEQFSIEETEWKQGLIYDPDSGKTYRANLKLVGPDHLEVRGYIATPLLGRTQQWTRLPLFRSQMEQLLKGDLAHD